MADAKSTAEQIKATAAKTNAVDLAEDAREAKSDVPAGHLRVRLVRPLIRIGQVSLPVGIYTLPAAEVPKSAKVLAKGEAAPAAK